MCVVGGGGGGCGGHLEAGRRDGGTGVIVSRY